MRLNYRPESIALGSVLINALSRVTELDSGLVTGPSQYAHLQDGTMTAIHSYETLHSIETQLAIVVPCMDEPLPILRGVLSGIPHTSQIIIVSNSNASNYQAERAMLSDFLRENTRQATITHQTSASLALAFSAAGMPQILHDAATTSPGRLRSGKGEAMMAGTALAKLSGANFVGFIDADNLVPGAVHEYCKVFAAGLYDALHLPFPHVHGNPTNERTLAMVRIKWNSKPKVAGGKLVRKDAGRCSRVVNAWMDRLLDAMATGVDRVSDFVRTANAGEHAMSMELALKLKFATGYAVEPYQLVDLLERAGGSARLLTPPASPRLALGAEGDGKSSFERLALGGNVRVLQVETMNPHIHDFGKGDAHIASMQAQGLSTVFHSQLIEPELKKELQTYMRDELGTVVGDEGVPEETRVYPAMEGMNWERFRDVWENPNLLTY